MSEKELIGLFVLSIVSLIWSHFAINACIKYDYLRHHLRSWIVIGLLNAFLFVVSTLCLIIKIF